MLFFSTIGRLLLVYQWQDVFEITVLSWTLYKIMDLLAHDTQKPLLRYFCTYLGLVVIAYNYNCLTLQIFLLVTAPALLAFFVFIHQESLQKNYVALYRPAAHLKKEIWHHHLIYLCQKLASKNQSSAFIIEKQQNLESLVTIGIECRVSFTPPFFEILYNSPDVFSERFFLLENDGTLRGINVTLPSHSILHSSSLLEETKLFLTAKTDALILEMNASTLTFTCIYNNKKLSNLSAHTMIIILDTFFGIKTNSLEGTMYESTFARTYNKTDHA